MAGHLAIRTVGIVGAGQMGMGIALTAASRAALPVKVFDKSSQQIEGGLKLVASLLAKDVHKGRISTDESKDVHSRISVVSALDKLKDCDLVVEAAAENLLVKQSIFSALSQICAPSSVLATNTSSISITKIAASVARPEMVVGLHFFNPVPVMKLVELIAGLQTSPSTLSRAQSFAEACGKEVTQSADVPGFVSNALLMPFLNEAIMCLEKGVATKEDIDKTLRLGMAHPMGPLQLADFIGLDTCLAIQQTLHRETGDDKYRPSVLLGRMVDAGWVGRKAGKGFYEY
ncbi:3-hydroxybutyryl-CoA dehydrogenase [Dacryopinax primogenitus]|uniref:3-hydroxybutyryl-CoA dehydrogenase n=1 Tax=Dacryopinax primogenitus (strain DJM 731) TaxID=1858805 RepID=M5FUL9_DACPD|nr:3-hydroxybutyryl-CoA dehydrogenase [Dacryopinax primogenitus]EJT96951.1 3-hydroxybutyryl-CoA dehydrogenase [Dacryopinax primogenitus]